MKRALIITSAAVAFMFVIVGAGVYAYYFSGLRTAPKQLSLGPTASPNATATASPTATSTSSSFTGKWSVASGSLVGFRVSELFAGQTAKHEAVVRTSTVSGQMTVSANSTGGYDISGVMINADLAGLHSVDQVAGRDVSQRDSSVRRQLNVQQFPSATFTADTVSVPQTAITQTTSLSIPGTLSVDGVSKHVTVTAQARVTGSRVEIAGSVSITMTDYGVSPPQAPFVTVDTAVTLEFDIFLTRAA